MKRIQRTTGLVTALLAAFSSAQEYPRAPFDADAKRQAEWRLQLLRGCPGVSQDGCRRTFDRAASHGLTWQRRQP